MAYIGKSIESGTFSVLDTSGNTYNGSNTAFNLGTQVGSVAQLLVSHDGVIQKPGTDYTLSSGGAAITFTTAPASGASIFIVEISGAVGGPLDSDLNGTELILDADGDTSITADTDDQIDIKIAGADDFSFTANTFTAAAGSSISSPDYSGGAVFNEGSADVDFRVEGNGDANLFFVDGGNDNIGISNAAPDTDAKFHISQGGYRGAGTDKHALLVGADIGDASSMTNSNRKLGSIVAPHYTNAEEPITIARLDSDNGSSELRIGGTAETNSTEKIIFRTASDDANKGTGADQMIIDLNGHVLINGADNTVGASLAITNDTTETTLEIQNEATSGTHRCVDFRNGDGDIAGSININTSGDAVSFETSSDYRLKENIVDLTGAITRVKNLKPKRFNFKVDTDTTLDGFLAHEAQSVVPEAVSGTKDETETRKNIVVNAKGNVKSCNITEAEWTKGKIDGVFANDTQWFASKEFMVKQGIDQAKLVPLLTAAIIELEARIATLEG